MTEGIVLMAFGAPAYGAMAFNMALSLKYHSPQVKIHLVYEKKALVFLQERHLKFFDASQEIEHDDLYDIQLDGKRVNEKLNPGKLKSRLYKYLPFDNNIYLDVDGSGIKPIESLMEECKMKNSFFLTQVVGVHSIQDGNDFKEMQWAWANDIWEHYKLKSDMKLPAMNSSFMFIKKNKTAEKLYREGQNAFDNPLPLKKLRTLWGGGQPDELAMNVACAKLRHNPDIESKPVFFATRHVDNIAELSKNHYCIGLYGGNNFTSRSLIAYYDRLIHKYSRELLGMNQEFKYHMLVKHKHANKK